MPSSRISRFQRQALMPTKTGISANDNSTGQGLMLPKLTIRREKSLFHRKISSSVGPIKRIPKRRYLFIVIPRTES